MVAEQASSAERVGENSQSVGRVLESFEEREFVVVGDEVVVVRNLEGLRQQAAARHG